MWPKKKNVAILNLLLKPSKETWEQTEGIHQHDHFIKEKMYHISFSTIPDKRSDFSFKKKSVSSTEQLGLVLIWFYFSEWPVPLLE